MNEFHDPEIERMLGTSGGPFPDVNVAFERVQGRVRQAKRRRAVVLASTACAILVAGAAFAVGRNQGSADVGPAGNGGRDSELRPDESFDAEPTTALVTTVTIATTETTTAPTTESTVAPATIPPTAAPGNTAAPHNTTAPTTPPRNTTPHTVPPTSPTTPTPTEPPATAAPPSNTTTVSGEGGSITVKLLNGGLTLVATHPANGFTAEIIQSSGNRVEVRFSSATHRTKLRVDLKNGAMYPRTPDEQAL